MTTTITHHKSTTVLLLAVPGHRRVVLTPFWETPTELPLGYRSIPGGFVVNLGLFALEYRRGLPPQVRAPRTRRATAADATTAQPTTPPAGLDTQTN